MLFVGRFVTAAWHKSDRYKLKASERRYHFKDAYVDTLQRNSISEGDVSAFKQQFERRVD